MPDSTKTVYAHAFAFATVLAGFAVAYFPNLAHSQQYMVAGGGVVLGSIVLIAHAIRARPAGQSIPVALEDALGPLVKAELAKLLSGGLEPTPAAPAPPVVAPVEPVAPPPAA